MKKRICAVLMSICIAIGLMLQFPVTALAAVSSGSGTWGGIDWVLSADGTLTISAASTPAAGPKNSPFTYDTGVWPEAVIYKANGDPADIGGWPYELTAVKKLVIEEGVTSIGSFTAKEFTNLTGEVVIPSTVTYIGQEAFQKTYMTELTFAPGGSGPLCIAPGAFKRLKITELILPADRPEIHVHCWAFQDCSNLSNIYLPDNVIFSDASKYGWTHADYYGLDYVWGQYATASAVFANDPINTVTFENEAAKNNFLSKNSLGSSVQTFFHTCQQSNWNWDEHNHYKKMCVYSTCPLNLSQKLFSLGAHTFGADDSCTVCGYIQNSKNKAPNTGDTTNTLLWTALFLGGVAMMWMQLNTRKRETF